MARPALSAFVLLSVLLLASTAAFAASCPYCGQQYGEGSGSDSAYIARIRAEHEANCPARNSGGGVGNTGGYGGGTYDYGAAREAYIARADARYDAAVAAYDNGDYDLAIKEASAALWMRWGNPRYLDILTRAQTRRRSQDEHAAGLANEKIGQWDAAISLYQAALRDYPENETYADALKRAQEGKAAADRDKVTGRLSALADELARPSPAFSASYRGLLGGRPSIDRIEVPTPKITPKDYVQIKVSKEWPPVGKQVVTLTNAALRALQDGVADFKAWGVDTAKQKAVEYVGGMLPGYNELIGLKDEAKELFSGVKEYTVGVYAFGMGGMEAGVQAQPSVGESARVSDLFSRRQEGAFEKTHSDVLKMASDKWKAKANEHEWEVEAEDGGDAAQPPSVVTINKPGLHPDYHRVYYGAGR